MRKFRSEKRKVVEELENILEEVKATKAQNKIMLKKKKLVFDFPLICLAWLTLYLLPFFEEKLEGMGLESHKTLQH